MNDIQILIAEDEKKIADTLKVGLEENDYTAAVAYDGSIAHKIFSSGTFDLVILDINLPGMNGFELCKAIRSQNAAVPVIMITSMSHLNDKIEGYNAGADDYIIKPFEFRELLLKIRVMLKRTMQVNTSAMGSILKAEDLQMNLDSKEVTRAGKKINLTAKEFQLLEYLLRNRNRMLSRADIAINVWDIDFDTNTNVIDVYISYLRNKIDKAHDTKLIHTQVGMGYTLRGN